MSIKIKPSAKNTRTFKQIGLLHANFKKGVRLGFEQVGASHKKTIKEDLNDKASKEGRVYVRRLEGRLVRHRASAPGQTAATFTGNYEKLVDTNINASDQMQFGAGAHYSRFLEEGTSRMEKRPSLGNTVEKEQRNTENYLGYEVYKALIKL